MSTIYVDNLTPNLGSRVMAAGHVVQVVSSRDTTIYTGTSGAEVYIGSSASITPTSTSSKILAQVSISAGLRETYSNYAVGFKLRRGTTTGGTLLTTTRFGRYDNETNVNREIYSTVVLSSLDSPATTSSVTYGIFVGNIDGSPTWDVNIANHSTMWTLMEIAQ